MQSYGNGYLCQLSVCSFKFGDKNMMVEKCKEKKSESFTTCQIETETSTTPGIAINPMVYRAFIGLGLKHSELNGEWPLNVIWSMFSKAVSYLKCDNLESCNLQKWC